MKSRLARIPLLIAVGSFISPATAAAGAWLLAPGEYYAEIRGSRLTTDRAWNDQGASELLPGSRVIERRAGTSYFEIGWKQSATVVFELPVESRTFREGSGDHATETGIGDLMLGFRYGLLRGASALSIQADWKAPGGYDRDRTPSLGSGQNDLTGSLSFGSPIRALNAFVDLAGGYRYRFEDPGDEIVGRAEGGLWIGPSVLLGGSYAGIFGLDNADGTAQKRVLHAVSPEIRYRVDDGFDFIVGWRHTLAGENALDTDDFYVGFAYKQTQLNRLQGFLGNQKNP